MRHSLLLLSASITLLTAANGCSALIDSGRYVGGSTDASVDTFDPNAPSAPVVELSPDAPSASDDLVATITTASVDPMGGTVTYETRWLADGVPIAGETGMTLFAGVARRDQTIRVEVTPVADTRRGAAGFDEVQIVNSLPVLSTVGLEGYFPSVGETVRAVPGTVFDADGDTAGVRYQWYDGATEIPGATTPALATDAMAAGAALRVEAWANDGSDGPRVSAGPVTLAADGTRWRQLLPNTGNEFPSMAWDAPNRRVVRFVDGGVWEYAITPTGFRTQRLPVTGVAPIEDESQITMHDQGSSRLLVFSEADRTAIFALDLRVRGAESWTRIPVGGTPPDNQLLQMVYYDGTNQRIWVIGGFDDGSGALDGIFSLDVSAPGAETWTRHTTTGATFPRIFGAAIAPDLTTPSRIYLIGGVTTPVPDTFTMALGVVQLDLTASVVTVTETAVTLPGPAWGAIASADARNGNILVYGGLDSFGVATAMPVGLRVFDPVVGAVTDVVNGPGPSIAGTLVPDERQPGHFAGLSLGGQIFGDGGFHIQVTDVTPTTVTLVAADDRPNELTDAFGRIGGDAIQIFGGRGDGVARTESWNMDIVTTQWSRLTTMPDSVTGNSPEPRFSVVLQTSEGDFSTSSLVLAGGAVADATPADMRGWELAPDGRWTEHTLTTGQTPPAPRIGGTVWGVNCGATVLGTFGGEDASGTPLASVANLECADAVRSCRWWPQLDIAAVPGRSFATAIAGRNTAFVFGGRTASGATNGVIGIDVCRTAPEYLAISVSGGAPSPRYGHAAAPVQDPDTGDLTSFYVFGGEDGTNSFDDTFRFVVTSDTAGTWEAVSPVDAVRPAGRLRHLAFWDATRSRVIVVGGSRVPGGRGTNDVWELRIRP